MDKTNVKKINWEERRKKRLERIRTSLGMGEADVSTFDKLVDKDLTIFEEFYLEIGGSIGDSDDRYREAKWVMNDLLFSLYSEQRRTNRLLEEIVKTIKELK